MAIGKGKNIKKLPKRVLNVHLINVLVVSFFSLTTIAQGRISGIVIDSDSIPIPKVTISIKGTNKATQTAEDGSFVINAQAGNTLIFSFIGYQTREVQINHQSGSLKITLSLTLSNLEEIVVTGYTSEKIKEITGSVAVVIPKDLRVIPAGQVEQMFQGRVAGLNVITSGAPGSASNVQLHGIGNFGDVTPLYIIDGVQGNINNLNPQDIESMQVLKDAGAYAIYGVRGSNGVIIITTRKGKIGKSKVSYDFYIGTTRPLKKRVEMLNPQEMADLTWIALKNSGDTLPNGNPNHLLFGNADRPVLPDYFIAGQNVGLFANDPLVHPALYNIDFRNGPVHQIVQANKKGTDWFHELFKPALSHNHSLAVSGGNEKNTYLVSFGYLNQQGTALNTYLKRYTARINTEFAVNKNIRIGENLQLSYRDNPQIAAQLGFIFNEILQSTLTNPILPVYDIKGGWAHLQGNGYFDENNVALRVIAKDDKSHSWEIAGNTFAEFDLLKYFTARTSFGGSFVNYYMYNYNFLSYEPLPNGLPNNSFKESSGYRRSWTWTNTLNFSKAFSVKHRINALIGIESINNYNRETGGSRSGFFTNYVNYRFLSNGNPTTQSNYSFAGASTLNSLLSQFNYGFNEKYFLKGTLRRDGSSVFAPQKRYGWFPSLSAAWIITEENFFKNTKWLTDLKLRASWGTTGFYGNTDPFNQYTLYGGSIGDAYYDINGTSNSSVQGFRVVRLGDPNTGWQKDIVSNIGFEGLLWNGRFSFTVDWYKKKAKGLLIPVSLPDVLGGSITPNINVGTIQNTGFDVLIASKGNWSDKWRWDAAVTVTTYKNRILKLTDIPYFIPGFVMLERFVRNEVGHPTSSFYGYKIIGIFKDDEEVSKAPLQNSAAPGRFRYLDNNNDNVIDDRDRIHFGHANPKFTTGINIGIYCGNFDYSIFFYGSFGNDVINYARTRIDFFASGNNDAKSKALLYNSWTSQNMNATLPLVENRYNFSNQATENDYALEDGSYFRNKSMILGYTFPKFWLDKMGFERVRMYIQAVNLFTLTKYKGFDPELSGQNAAFGIDFANYPNNQKQYLFGMSIGF
jgi:TonB-linked SusC/RagA family outer membrane protein